jgi:hypothetical protein
VFRTYLVCVVVLREHCLRAIAGKMQEQLNAGPEVSCLGEVVADIGSL